VNKKWESYAQVSHLVVFCYARTEDSGFFTPTLKLKQHVVISALSDYQEIWLVDRKKIVLISRYESKQLGYLILAD
jgi:long-chain acyl-CoA synthetase